MSVGGKPPALSYPKLKLIDAWMVLKPGYARQRTVPINIIARRLGINRSTVFAAYYRRGAYRDCARSA